MSASPADHVIPLEGVLNLRELGGYPAGSNGETRLHRLLRSADLDRLPEQSQHALIDYGLRTVIDLRDAGEIEAAPDPFAASPDVNYCWLPFFDDAGVRMGPPDFTKTKGARYLWWLDNYHDSVRAAFQGIAAAREGVTLFHCVAGKDRTGLVAGILLALAGVPDEIIAADYAISYLLLKPATAVLREQAEKNGDDMTIFEKRAACAPETMQEVLDGLRTRFGGPAGFLRAVGLSDPEIAALGRRLLG